MMTATREDKVGTVTFRPSPEQAEAMKELKDRDGIIVSEQVRRALDTFLAEKGVLKVKKSAKGKKR